MSDIVIHDRGEWESDSQPVTGPNAKPGKIEYGVLHWPGVPDRQFPTDAEGVKRYLRGEQGFYEDHRGYSVGYCFFLDRAGEVWTARGLDIRNAANDGDKGIWRIRNFNKVSDSLQVMCSEREPITDAQRRAIPHFWKWLDNQRGRRLQIQGHRVTDHTTCPGPLTALMDELSQRPQPPIFPDLEDDMKPEIISLQGEDATWVSSAGGKWPISPGGAFAEVVDWFKRNGLDAGVRHLDEDQFRARGPNLGPSRFGKKRDWAGVPK